MLSDFSVTEYSYLVSARFEAINSRYLELIAKQIKEIGRISPTNLHRLQQMAKVQQNIEEINKLLSNETNKTLEELYKVYDISGMSAYSDTFNLFTAKGITPLPFKDNMVLQGYLNSVKQLTQGTFINMANTTVLSDKYKELVDLAIDAVVTGQSDYMSVIRSQMIGIADEGISVTYASGIKRRLDSAIRMNILEGVRKVNEGVRQAAGEQFGADGYEITAHALCAEDHIHIQGKQFAKGGVDKTVNGITYESYDVMNNNLKRHLGTCNCKHTTFPILLGISTPTYSNTELRKYKTNSEKKVDLTTGYNKDGVPLTKSVTRYEATQYQRKLETEIRKAKDRHIILESAGDTVGTKQAKDRILALRKSYKRISEEAGLTPKWDRTFVAGYTGIGNPKPKDIVLKPTSKNFTTIGNELNLENISQFAKENINRAINKFENEFSVNDLITSISYTEKDFEGLMEGSYAYIHPDSPNILHLNPKVYQSEDIFDSYVGNRIKAYHNNATPESILIHEQAHILGTMLDENSILSKSISQYFEKFPNIKNSDPMYKFMPDFQIVGEQISRYASTTDHELWAEAVADFIINKNNSSEFSKILVDNIKEALK